nr:hypothetical protein BaRGS_014576 [Batillaria attramentaria]
MILDDAEVLVEEFTPQIRQIMSEYASCLEQSRQLPVPRQILLFSTAWTPGVASFQCQYQLDPVLVFASRLEASVFGKVQQQLVELLNGLTTGPDHRRIIITTETDERARDIEKEEATAVGLGGAPLPGFAPSEVTPLSSSPGLQEFVEGLFLFLSVVGKPSLAGPAIAESAASSSCRTKKPTELFTKAKTDLRLFARAWRSLVQDPWATDLVENGLQLSFVSPPPLRRSPMWTEVPQDASKAAALRSEVAALLQKQPPS